MAARSVSPLHPLPPTAPGRAATPAGPGATPPRLRLVRAPAGWSASDPTQEAGDPSATAGVGQTALDLEFLLPGGLAAVPEVPIGLLAPAPRRCPAQVIEESGPPTERAALPPVGPWAARLAQAVLEVCTAGRPVAQLLRWTEPKIYRELEQRYTPHAQRDLRRRRVKVAEHVRSVHVCEPADGVAEVSVVIVGGERPRALALRLEGWRDRWVCTVLDWV